MIVAEPAIPSQQAWVLMAIPAEAGTSPRNFMDLRWKWPTETTDTDNRLFVPAARCFLSWRDFLGMDKGFQKSHMSLIATSAQAPACMPCCQRGARMKA